ncbi:MAG: 2-C-methyl-D-erythritol 4-phosphate cytidylyltransferase [Actinobacteria bacterium]|nr:MAG: 2-C-methyl-D-erythritol 4-phosphate cytidylyltransferase [Actinomycetota bacterium]HMC81269.1 2-C-methyl-D-erythritol 4-phosphate cytidylyltransferase [Acidimicrobiia bacterium]
MGEPGTGRAGVWAIVVAAGSSSRFGRLKQFEPLAGRQVLDWSIDAARSVAGGVVLVVPGPARVDERRVEAVVGGGSSRAASVRAGLDVVPDDAEVIVVHDAARPLGGVELFRAVVEALVPGVDGAIPGLPLAETVKQVAGDRVVSTLDRTELVAVQTPQAFRAERLRSAHRSGGEATDDAALVEAAGGTIVVVPGDPRNIKLTQPSDLVVLEALLRS